MAERRRELGHSPGGPASEPLASTPARGLRRGGITARAPAVAAALLGSALLSLAATTAPAAEVGLLVRFGLTDRAPSRWDGAVELESGEVREIRGWRFRGDDAVLSATRWRAATRPIERLRRSNRPERRRRVRDAVQDNGVLLSLSGVDATTHVRLRFPDRSLDLRLGDLRLSEPITRLGGAVAIERTAPFHRLTRTRDDDDRPALAVGRDGVAHVAWVRFRPGLPGATRVRLFYEEPADLSFLARPAGGDQLWLASVDPAGRLREPTPVTEPGRDIERCAVAVDGAGGVWVFWSERRGSNFDLLARRFAHGSAGPIVTLADDPGNDLAPVAASDARGRVWVAWQGARQSVFRILVRRETGSGWAPEQVVSTQRRSAWTPAIAASADGRVAIAWDTYEKGDYDVWMREISLSGAAQPARPVTSSRRYEARAALAYAPNGDLWIAWEDSEPSWGKDFGRLVRGKGIGLYESRRVGLRVWRRSHGWLAPRSGPDSVLPWVAKRPPGARALPVPALEPEGETAAARRAAERARGRPFNNLARIALDRAGRLWLLVRSRANAFRTQAGSLWLTYAAVYAGDRWRGPILVPGSDAFLSARPAVARDAAGGILVVQPSDHRQARVAVPRDEVVHGAKAWVVPDPFDGDLFAATLEIAGDAAPLALDAATPPEPTPAPSAETIAERREIARARTYRTKLRGTELVLARGELHRHTELSGDGAMDGPLEDMWRYAIDVADLDWIGNGDHDSGSGREHPWWLIQKTTDAYRLPGRFDTLFSYERSVGYPEGHRNVIFARRGIRPLPRLPLSDEKRAGHAPDTQMLYRFLHRFGGLSSPHTTATVMGTDWRDNDPEVEPFVEIYQGSRFSYERRGAPRAVKARSDRRLWRPKGFVNEALAKGYRLAFQASSDHRSTHISYAMVWTPERTRKAIFEAMRSRHVYAATDNIVAEMRCIDGDREHFLGEEFTVAKPPTIQVVLAGTAPFSRVVVIKDDEIVHEEKPGRALFRFSFTDPSPMPGRTSWYYVRGEQGDGELVWISPMWIRYEPAPAGTAPAEPEGAK